MFFFFRRWGLDRAFVYLSIIVLLAFLIAFSYFAWLALFSTLDFFQITAIFPTLVFFISASYFLFYVILIIAHMDQFFVYEADAHETFPMAGAFLYMFSFGGFLVAVLIFGIWIHGPTLFSSGSLTEFSLKMLVLPSALVAAGAMTFDIGNVGLTTLFGLHVRSQWESIFREAVKVDLAVLFCFAILLCVAVVGDAIHATQDRMAYIKVVLAVGEGFALFFNATLFAVESIYPFRSQIYTRVTLVMGTVLRRNRES